MSEKIRHGKKDLACMQFKRGGENRMAGVDCCRRAKKKFGETLTRRARDSLRGVYA